KGKVDRRQERVELRISNTWQQTKCVGREVTWFVHLNDNDIGLRVRADSYIDHSDVANTFSALDLDILASQQDTVVQGLDAVDVERAQPLICGNCRIIRQFQEVDTIQGWMFANSLLAAIITA